MIRGAWFDIAVLVLVLVCNILGPIGTTLVWHANRASKGLPFRRCPVWLCVVVGVVPTEAVYWTLTLTGVLRY